jgi:hypothetical protein
MKRKGTLKSSKASKGCKIYQDLGYELSCVLQFIAIKTQLTLRQLAFLLLKIINPILFERQRVEKIGLFKPADSPASSPETEIEPPSKKAKK